MGAKIKKRKSRVVVLPNPDDLDAQPLEDFQIGMSILARYAMFVRRGIKYPDQKEQYDEECRRLYAKLPEWLQWKGSPPEPSGD